ncbi:hypothetical protein Tco_0874881 [Tanacetum coccineum]|uniref:Reverse transcriptase domain-containing protein n=1 Tax=Tanacetum coccineum TaxID=301880 RepID=A0ABQ5BMX3_9ASTR
MPPKMMKRKAVKKMVKKRVVESIAEYGNTRANLDNAGGSGSVNTGGVVAPNVQGCTHETFVNEKGGEGRAARVCESNKRKWEDHQRNTNNNKPNNNNNRNRNVNTHHQRQEAAKVYVAAPTDRRNYAGNAPYCNKCRLHHYGQCPPECGKCHKIGNPEKDYRVRIPGAGVNSM